MAANAIANLQLPEGYTVRKVGNSLKVVPMKKKAVVVKQEKAMLRGVRVDAKGEMDLLRSIQATYEAANEPFTAEEMLEALTKAANGENVFNLNPRRVNSFLTACCMQYGLKLEGSRYIA
jgi:hypothetical protein